MVRSLRLLEPSHKRLSDTNGWRSLTTKLPTCKPPCTPEWGLGLAVHELGVHSRAYETGNLHTRCQTVHALIIDSALPEHLPTCRPSSKIVGCICLLQSLTLEHCCLGESPSRFARDATTAPNTMLPDMTLV